MLFRSSPRRWVRTSLPPIAQTGDRAVIVPRVEPLLLGLAVSSSSPDHLVGDRRSAPRRWAQRRPPPIARSGGRALVVRRALCLLCWGQPLPYESGRHAGWAVLTVFFRSISHGCVRACPQVIAQEGLLRCCGAAGCARLLGPAADSWTWPPLRQSRALSLVTPSVGAGHGGARCLRTTQAHAWRNVSQPTSPSGTGPTAGGGHDRQSSPCG